jgi:hypothetical protein
LVGQKTDFFYTEEEKYWNDAKNICKNSWNGAKNACKNSWNGAKNACKNSWNGAKNACKNSWNGAIMKRKAENDVVYLPLYMAGML